MERIYYGTLTIDVSDVVASKLRTKIDKLNEHEYSYFVHSAGIGTRHTYQVGKSQRVTVSGRVEGAEVATKTDLILGPNVPLAIVKLSVDDLEVPPNEAG